MSTPLVGHDGLVGNLLRDVNAGRGAMLRGVPGIGKSRLLIELVRAVRSAGGRPAALVSCAPALTGVTLGVFRALTTGNTGVDAVRAEILARDLGVLAVDDAHLLDPASAGLLYELALDGLPVVVAVRRDEPLPDAVREIWKSGLIALHEIGGLTLQQTSDLIRHLLGPEVDSGLSWLLHTRGVGNPLMIRELVAAGLRDGGIRQRRQLWSVSGPLPDLPHLSELMDLRVRGITPAVRSFVEIVALAEPVGIDLARVVGGHDVIDAAEAAGVVTVDVDADLVRLSHPLLQMAVLSTLPTLRRRRHFQVLLSALPMSRSELTQIDRVQLARWSREVDLVMPVEELMAVAALTAQSDPEFCEQLLRAAVDAGGGPVAQLRLAHTLAHRHQVDEAHAVLSAIDTDSAPTAVAAGVAATTAFLMAMPGQSPERALEFIDDLVVRHGPAAELSAVRSTALWRSRRFDEAMTLAKAVTEDPAAPPPAVAHAGLTYLSLLLAKGDGPALSHGLALVGPSVNAAASGLPEGPDALGLIEALTPVQTVLDVVEGVARADRGYSRMLRIGDDGMRAQYALVAGWCRLHLGEVTEALRLLREAEVARGQWCGVTLPWVRSMMIEALVVAGDQTNAVALHAELVAGPRAPVYHADIALAEAAILAGTGDLAAARKAARHAAAFAADAGQAAIAAAGWYAALRYGDTRTAELLGILRRLPGPARAAQRAHAEAVRDRSPEASERAAGALWAVGLRWFALECQAQAIQAYRAQQDPMVATGAAERLRTLGTLCPDVHSPVVRAMTHPGLTEREAQVARLAAARQTDQQIAEQLSLSVRTVETHLGRVYRKLGIRRRTDLGVVLGAEPPTSRSGGRGT